MGKRHATLLVIDLYGLTVGTTVGTRRPIPHVRDCHRRGGNRLQLSSSKHLADKPQILMREEQAVVVHHDSAALLPAMLERLKAHIA